MITFTPKKYILDTADEESTTFINIPSFIAQASLVVGGKLEGGVRSRRGAGGMALVVYENFVSVKLYSRLQFNLRSDPRDTEKMTDTTCYLDSSEMSSVRLNGETLRS